MHPASPPRPVPDEELTSASTRELIRRCDELIADGQRRILGIVGPPGAGKSTLSAALAAALGSSAAVVPMDGFHLARGVLEELGREGRKGAPDTFDPAGYISLLSRLRDSSGEVVYAPLFDRGSETAIAAALPIPHEVTLVITEGNYLLHTGGGWEGVRPLLDEAWYLDVPRTEVARRLASRREEAGDDRVAAHAWVTQVDLPNAALVERSAPRADLKLRWRR